MERFIEKVAYETLKETNPVLLATVENVISQGGTAKQVERRLTRRYGKSMIVDGAILAARHLERQRKAA